MSASTIDLTAALAHSRSTSVEQLFRRIDHIAEHPVEERSHLLASGFDPLDRVLGGGLRPHDFMVVAGRPGVGKTIAVLQMARNLARAGHTVVYACYEHDPTVLLARLLALEIGEVSLPHTDWYRMDGVRLRLDEVVSGRGALRNVAGDPLLRAARAAVEEYAPRLHLVSASPSVTGVAELASIIHHVRDSRGGRAVLCVDYLQKVRSDIHGVAHLDEVTDITSALRELSLDHDVAVIAICAMNASGLRSERVRMSELDGAVSVGYDADVVVMLDDKRRIVSTNQLAYSTEQSDRFRRRVVFTVEKNRGGVSSVDLEFIKDFEHFRFDPTGSYVSEQLID